MVPTPVSKTGWPEMVRVRVLHLPRMSLEDKLAVARAPVATRLEPARACGSTPLSSAEVNCEYS